MKRLLIAAALLATALLIGCDNGGDDSDYIGDLTMTDEEVKITCNACYRRDAELDKSLDESLGDQCASIPRTCWKDCLVDCYNDLCSPSPPESQPGEKDCAYCFDSEEDITYCLDQ